MQKKKMNGYETLWAKYDAISRDTKKEDNEGASKSIRVLGGERSNVIRFPPLRALTYLVRLLSFLSTGWSFNILTFIRLVARETHNRG